MDISGYLLLSPIVYNIVSVSVITKVIAKSAEWGNIAKKYIYSEHGNKWLDNQTDLIFGKNNTETFSAPTTAGMV